jgi:hypothetical protein
MADYVKFDQFVEDLGSAVHDLRAAGDTLKIYLTNTAPNVATHALKGDLAGITEENGYAAADIQNDYSQTGGTATLTGVDVTWTATAGGFGPARYVVMYNSTTTVKTDPLICYWDYGSSITVSEGEDLMADVAASLATLV